MSEWFELYDGPPDHPTRVARFGSLTDALNYVGGRRPGFSLSPAFSLRVVHESYVNRLLVHTLATGSEIKKLVMSARFRDREEGDSP